MSKHRKFIQSAVFATVPFFGGQAWALSLGDLQVRSALDEPLVAEIVLTSVVPEELETLTISLGSAADFSRAGVQRTEMLNALQFEVVTDALIPMIRVYTQQPAKEPFLHFVVSAEWAGGKLVREYTALLDPPLYVGEPPSAPVAPPVIAEQPSAPAIEAPAPGEGPAAEPEPAVAETPAGAAPETATPPVESTSAASQEGVRYAEYGPTEAGDTLWAIASRLDTGDKGVDIFQIMVALLRENPDAFIDNNINQLKKGQILRINDLDAIGQISKAEATAAYKAQLEEWQVLQAQLARASEQVSVPGEMAKAAPGTTKPSAGTGTAPDTGAAAGGGEPQQDVLKIVRATVDKQEAGAGADSAARAGAAAAEMAALRDQMSTMEESLASKELENRELGERVKLLEEQVQKAQRLIEIRDRELALAQQQAQQAQSQAATASREASEAARQAAQAAQQAKLEQARAEQAQADLAKADLAKAAEQAKAELAKPVVEEPPAAAPPQPKPKPQPVAKPAPKPAAAKPAPAPKPAPRRVAAEPEQPSQSWWDGILETVFSSWMWMAAAGVGVIVLVVGGLLFLRRRRSIAEFEESILSGSALEGQTETTDTSATGSATDTSFLSDFGMAGMGNMQADEVDPLAEAEVYLAYGRDEQAEEVLKEAVTRTPQRPELKLKLLEIYQQRNDLKSFETLAEELYPASGQDDPQVWQKVVEMGRKMNPNNPLFTQAVPGVAAAAAAGAAAAAPEDMADTLDLEAPDFGAPDEEEAESEVSLFDEPEPATRSREQEAVSRQAETPTLELSALEGERPGEEEEEEPDELAMGDVSTVEPGLQPFPKPEANEELDRELERLAGDMESVSGAASEPGAKADEAVDFGGKDDDTLNFSTTNVSELDFDLDLEEEEARDDSQPERKAEASNGRAAQAGNDTLQLADLDLDFDEKRGDSEKSDDGGTLEFEAENIPPEETWGPASDDRSPHKKAAQEDESSFLDDAELFSDADSSEDDDEQWDEAATKLDLARAYLDMGDKAGAKSIIEEVMKEGNSSQRDQAAELASQL